MATQFVTASGRRLGELEQEQHEEQQEAIEELRATVEELRATIAVMQETTKADNSTG